MDKVPTNNFLKTMLAERSKAFRNLISANQALFCEAIPLLSALRHFVDKNPSLYDAGFMVKLPVERIISFKYITKKRSLSH